MSKVEIRGRKVAYTGGIKGFKKGALEARITALGGTPMSSVKPGTDILIARARPGEVPLHAAWSMGAVVVGPEHHAELLEHGEVELAAPETIGLDEAIASARSSLAQPPSRASWRALTALVDACEPGAVEQLVDYLEPLLERWPARVTGYRDPDEWGEPGVFGDAAGAPRVLPPRWLGEMLAGVEHPRYRLCDALSFTGLFVGSTAARRVFAHPEIGRVRTFCLGRVNETDRKKKTFFKDMAAHLDHVETLCLGHVPAAMLDALARPGSLPALRALYLNYDARVGPEAAEAFFGPWSGQLEEVGVRTVAHLEVLAERAGELPVLRALTVPCGRDAERMAAAFGVLGGGLDTLRLGCSSRDLLVATLGALGDIELDVLDLSEVRFGGWTRDDLDAIVVPYMIDTGLAGRVREIVVDQMGSAIVARLRAEGAQVTRPGHVEEAAAVDEAPAAQVEPPPEPSWEGMTFPDPSWRAWWSILGVVEQIARERAPAEYAAAIDALEVFLEPWPAHLRPAPETWYGDYVHAHDDPKLRLPRAFLIREMDLPRDAGVWLEGFAERANLEHITHLHLSRVPKGKYFQKAALAMFRAARPRTWNLLGFHDKANEALEGLLTEEGFGEQAPDEQGVSVTLQTSSNMDVLGRREVSVLVDTLETLKALLERTDMDHVVTFDLSFHKNLRGDPGALDVTPASWGRLRYLTVGKAPPEVIPFVTRWLSQARPAHIAEQFRLLRTRAPDQSMRLAEAGVYARALTASLELPVGIELARLRDLFSREDVSVEDLRLANGLSDSVSLRELVEAMSPRIRAHLRRLSWAPHASDLDALEPLLQMLPRLSHLTFKGVPLASKEGRAPLLEALATAPSFARLTTIGVDAMGAKHAPVSAAEKKALGRGVGARADALRLW